MKYLIFLLISLFVLGCDTPSGSGRLDMVDSLIVAEKYDLAYHEVVNYIPKYEDEKEMAHYRLLLTQTSYLTYNELPADSIIDTAIAYYEKSDDGVRLADSYYYKASILHERNEDKRAIEYYKKAEDIADMSRDLRLQYKVAESMTKFNNQNRNYNLQLTYARKALGYALDAGNKNWIAYSYFNLSYAFQNLEMIDSMSFYTRKIIPMLGDIYPDDLPHFLSCIGFMYFKNGDIANAKKCYEEALKHKEVAQILVNLADVYVEEGNEEEAYHLWQKAFLSANEFDEKDVIMFNILQYDLKHQKSLEDACERMYRIYAIKDSMTYTLKDRTIQDLQQRYDEESLSHFYERKLMRWMIVALVLILFVLFMMGYVRYKRFRSELLMAKQQMLILKYNDEISQLTKQSQKAKQEICHYMSMISDYQKQMRELESSGESADRLIEEKNKHIVELVRKNEELEKSYNKAVVQREVLRQEINGLIETASPMLNRGKILYDSLLSNQSIISWSKNDFRCFVEYYKALNIKEYESIVHRYKKLTYHNLLYLILCDMGLNSQTISQIMGISPESIRAIRHRLQKNIQED